MSLSTLVVGGKVVHPSKTFVAQSVLELLSKESCTTMPLVPPMLHALFEYSSVSDFKLETLKTIVVGGASLSPQLLKDCKDKLHVEHILNAYGQTEGTSALVTPLGTDMLITPEFASVGQVYGGSMVKVCAPDTKEVVQRGERGELHQGGLHLIKGYLKVEDQPFYDDEHGHWLPTGDQAYMDEAGNVFLTGRYKELIIRGGENISAAAIESHIREKYRLDVRETYPTAILCLLSVDSSGGSSRRVRGRGTCSHHKQ